MRFVLWLYSLFTKKRIIFISIDEENIKTISNIEDDEEFYKLIAEVYCTDSDEMKSKYSDNICDGCKHSNTCAISKVTSGSTTCNHFEPKEV